MHSGAGDGMGMTEHDDASLISEVRAGSRVALEALIRRYERSVYRTAYGYAREHEETLDLTQRVFLKVVERIGSYRGEGPFGGWLLRIAHREGLNWVRERRRRPGRVPLLPEQLPPTPARQESERLCRERREHLQAGLQSLNPRQLLAVTLRYQEGLPLREIARALDCSEGSVKSILFRSLEKLRRGFGIRRRGRHVDLPAGSSLDRKAHCRGDLAP
jgi:RNA polymerase sigma-70 factor (ECF subfamily)